ncbi:MAG: two-component regulator propeller domain-containing protein [Ignavibacteriaceae bacterium]
MTTAFIKQPGIFIIILFLFPEILSPQDIQVNIDHISNDNGLSQNTVHYIMQDSKGFIWFATEDGLNKYDGYNFTIYKNDPQDKNSIPDNFIWTICEDNKGDLWIGTNNGGLSKFIRTKEKFVNYTNNPDDPGSLSFNNVRTIFEDKQGDIWVGTETGGLDKFIKTNKTFIHHRHDPLNSNSLSNDVVLSLFEDNNGYLWIGSDGGLDRFDREKNKIVNYKYNPVDSNSLSNNVVLSIYEDNDGYMWIGTLSGLTRFDKKKNEFTRFFINEPDSKNPNSNRINSILEDREGVLWVGTGGGLYQFDRKTERFALVTYIYSTSSILNNKNILTLFEDSSGLVWIGSAEDGAAKYDRERMKFRHYKHDPHNENSLSHNTVRSIYQEDEKTLWIGTLGGGLNKLNLLTNKFTHYQNKPGELYSLSDNSVSAIWKDSYGFLWVGTWNSGLNRTVLPYHSSSNLKFLRYSDITPSSQRTSSHIVQAIFEDSNRNLWVGTGTGLNLLDRKNNRFINFTNNPNNLNSISSNLIQSCILEDKNGNLWIGTWEGLNKLSSSDKNKLPADTSINFIHYTFKPDNEYSLSDNRVISAFEDKDGNLWFGTYGGGLNMLSADDHDSPKPKFINYTTRDGLPSNIVYSVQGDNNGNIWVSTDNGLAVFNPKTKAFTSYDISDGLQSNQFFWGAGYKGVSGEMFFGGTNGFNAFNPEYLKINEHIPPVVITNFQIFNRPVEIDAPNSPLVKTISETKEIELSYGQNVFSFEFASLDFTAPGKNRYAYKMEGFDEGWINSDNRRFVTYTNLYPGEYVFRVKGSNSDGIWNEEGAAVTLRILPPLWMTWWFITLSVLLIGGIIAFLITYRVKHLLNIERFRAKLAADLHDNIGSSLTEISIWSEIIRNKIKNPDKDIEKSLKMISNNSRNLIDNMSDIVWLVNPKRDSLYDLILRLRDTYAELSSYTSISFKSENIKALEKVSLSIEHRQHLYLIFKEAINNSITHSECTEISLDAFVKGRKLEMILADNGRGFNGTSSSGNGLENIKNRAELIGGKLDINSLAGKGTTVKFEGNIL